MRHIQVEPPLTDSVRQRNPISRPNSIRTKNFQLEMSKKKASFKPQTFLHLRLRPNLRLERMREKSRAKKKNLTKLTLIVRCKFYSNFVSLCAVGLAKTFKPFRLFVFVFLASRDLLQLSGETNETSERRRNS
jgi:hypothetical protein